MTQRPRGRLVLGKNLSIRPEPQMHPSQTSPHILVVGGGVTGLTSAWVLLDRGYRVTVVAKEWASYGRDRRLTSQIAGALWEFPPAVCGQHTDAISLNNSKRWCMVAYAVWRAIAADSQLSTVSGVRMKRSAFFFPVPLEEDPAQMEKFREISDSGIDNVRRSTSLIQEHKVNPEYGAVDAYEHLAPIIDTDVAMNWLMTLVQKKGAMLETETIHGDLFEQEDSIRARFNVDAIVNATGLNGIETAGDQSCYPIRGGLIRVINDGTNFPKVTSALTITADAVHDSNEIVFIVPRSDRILLLGGISQRHEWSLDLSLDSSIIQRMRKRCEAFLPGLQSARIDEEYPLAQGLRPFRQRNVRVERELRRHRGDNGEANHRYSRIVHSYGQGGAGWSLSFGCANDVASLVEDALRDLPAQKMAVSEPRIEAHI